MTVTYIKFSSHVNVAKPPEKYARVLIRFIQIFPYIGTDTKKDSII